MPIQCAPTIATNSVDRQLYQRFSKLSLPRHTSYPSIPNWTAPLMESAISSALREIAQSNKHSSFYLHVPFCERLCHYCGCNKLVISRAHDEAEAQCKKYLDSIGAEMDWMDQHLDGRKWNVSQIHWGGGTPTWLGLKDLESLWARYTKNMNIAPDAEVSIEIDPRVTSFEHLKLLRELGFNRVSLGVQDFNHDVQVAIQRIQPLEMVEQLVHECRRVGFKSVNFDLIYGLPMQTKQSMSETLSEVIALKPDRIAFYRLALMPEIFKWQRTFKAEDIPGDDAILDFMIQALDRFTTHGWCFIGLDHFARADDELSIAYKNGTLRRSFQGMTTGDELPVIGIGPSAISCLDGHFAQNESRFPVWSKMVQQTGKSYVKGHHLTADDRIRRWVLGQLYCYRFVDKNLFKQEFGYDFDQYFVRSKTSWIELERLGLIDNSPNHLRARPLTGWLLLRVVAATFDGYLNSDAWSVGVRTNTASRVG